LSLSKASIVLKALQQSSIAGATFFLLNPSIDFKFSSFTLFAFLTKVAFSKSILF
jgi:hypothetical protein